MVAMLSPRSAGPYMSDMPMAPSPIAETSEPVVPNFKRFMASPLLAPNATVSVSVRPPQVQDLNLPDRRMCRSDQCGWAGFLSTSESAASPTKISISRKNTSAKAITTPC